MGNPYSPASHMTGHAASKATKSAAQLIGPLIPNVLTSDLRTTGIDVVRHALSCRHQPINVYCNPLCPILLYSCFAG